MKKILFFLFISFWPIFVNAEDILLKNIIISNGELSLPFDSYNTEYTVTLDEKEFHLDLNYEVEEGIIVSVNNNHDLENNSVVTLSITKGEDKLDYYFHILKDTKQNITVFSEEKNAVETNFMYEYKIYIIPSICFVLIIICHKILFKKHKNKII